MKNLPTIHCEAIGYIRSPYQEKFAVPRQPGLVESEMTLQLISPYDQPEMVRGLEQFSHLWLLFAFHQHIDKGWSPTVRPPRLGGNKKIGVFASRATYRPNPIGMSVVKLKRVEIQANSASLILSGGDLVDSTPILDIKPYIPYADSHPEAAAGYASTQPQANLKVTFSTDAITQLEKLKPQYPDFMQLIEQVLAQDPRPAYHKTGSANRQYGVKLYQFDVQWQMLNNQHCIVNAVLSL